MTSMTVYDHAKAFVAAGISVIPIDRNSKRPLLRWKEYQSRIASQEELKKWFDTDIPPNLAVVGGAVSGNLVILDFDDVELYHKFWQSDSTLRDRTVLVKSARGRYHVWFRAEKTFSKFKPVDKLDVQAEGSYVLAPPSETPEGRYEFITPLHSTPMELFKTFSSSSSRSSKLQASLIGKLRSPFRRY